MNFQNGRGESPACQRRLRQPESIIQPARRCMENGSRIDTELTYARDIGNAGFASEKTVRDPEHGSALVNRYGRGKRQDKARCRPRIIHGERPHFGDGIQYEATVQCLIKHRDAERQTCPFILYTPSSQIRLSGCNRGRQSLAFHFGDLFAQGKNRFLRRGVSGHGVSSISICSLYVLIDSRACRESQSAMDRNLFLICYSNDSYLEKSRHWPYM